MVDYNINVIANPQEANRGIQSVERNLKRVEQEAVDVDAVLKKALAQRDQGTLKSLQQIERSLDSLKKSQRDAQAQAASRNDPYRNQVVSIQQQNQLLTDQLAFGAQIAQQLQVERRLRQQGVQLTKQQQAELSGELSRQAALNDQVRQQAAVQRELQSAKSRTRQLTIEASTAEGAQRDFLLAQNRLREQGVRLTDQQTEELRQQFQRQSLLTREIRTQRGELERSNQVVKSSTGLFRTLFAGVGVALVTRQLGAYADQVTNVQNRLRLVTDTNEELIATQNELLDISDRTRVSFERTSAIFGRLAVSGDDLGRTNQELLRFTESLNQAIVLSGASATEANAGLIQLSQGLASGALRGDELRSVLEQLPAVADVIAKGLGVTRGELRALGAEGKITADIVLDAFKEARQELDERFRTTVPTIGQAFTVLQNQAIEAVGGLNEATGASEGFARILIFLGDNLEAAALSAGIFGTAVGVRLAVNAIPAAIAGVAKLNATLLLSGGAYAAAAGGVFLLSNRIQQFNEDIEAIGETLRQVEEESARIPTAFVQISALQREINSLQRAIENQARRGVEASDSQIQRLAELERRLDSARNAGDRFVQQQRDQAAATEAAAEAARVEEQTLARREALLQAIRGPAQDYANLQADLNALLEQGRITQEEFNQALREGREAFDSSRPTPQTPSDPAAPQRRTEPERDVFGDQLADLAAGNRFLEDRIRLGDEVAENLRAQRDLELEIGKLSTDQETALANQTLQRQALVEQLRQQREIQSTFEALRERESELDILATTQAGARRDAALVELRLRERGVRLTEDQSVALLKQLETQRELTEAADRQDRVDRLREQIDVTRQVAQAEEDLRLLREQEPELADEIDRAFLNLRERQLQSATDLASGFERAFIRIRREAEDLATVGDRVVNVFADRATDAITEFAQTGRLNFREFATSLLADIQRIIVRLLVVRALSAVIGGPAAGAVSAGAGALNSGAQFGATVQPGQAPRPVGENGPELFIPNRTGVIQPLNPSDLQGGGAQRPEINIGLVTVQSLQAVNDALSEGEFDDVIINRVGENSDRVNQATGGA